MKEDVLGTNPIQKAELQSYLTKDDSGKQMLDYDKLTSGENSIPIPKRSKSTPYNIPSQPTSKYVKRVSETAPTIGVNMQEELALDQTVAERLAYLVPRAATKALASAMSMPGYLSGFEKWSESGFSPDEFGKAFDNGWITAVDNAEEDIKSLFPIYTPEAVLQGGLWKNLGSASFWANEGADGIGFLLGMMAPGAIIKAAKLGVGVQNAAKIIKPGLQLSEKLAGTIDDYTSVAMNTVFESATEARDTYQTAMDKFNNVDIASRAAANTFNSNIGILLWPNILQQKWIFNGFNRGKTAANNALNRLVSESGEIVDKVNPLSTLGKIGKVGKKVATGVLSEGFFEEGLQNVVADLSVKGINPLNNLDEVVSDYLESALGSDQQSTEFWKSVVLGGLLGGGMASVGGVRELKAEDRFLNTYHDILKNNYLRKFSTLKDFAETENGSPKINPETKEYILDKEKLAKAAKDNLSEAKLNNFMSVLKASGEEEAYEYFKTVQDNRYILPYIEVEGGLELFKKHVNWLAQQEAKQDEKENGIATDNVDNIKDDLIKKAERLQRIYNEVKDKNNLTLDNSIKYDSINTDTFNEFKKEVEGGKISSKLTIDFSKDRISKLRSDLSNDFGISSSTTKLSNKLVDELNNSFEEIKKSETIDPQEEEVIKSKISAIAKHIETNTKATSKLKDLYTKSKLQDAFNGMLLDKEKAKVFESQKTNMKNGMVKIKTADGDVYGVVESQTNSGNLLLRIVNKTDKGYEETNEQGYLSKNGKLKIKGKVYDVNYLTDLKNIPFPKDASYKKTTDSILKERLYDKDIENEGIIENNFSDVYRDSKGNVIRTFEPQSKHEFDGTINSFLYAAMNQSQADENEDVARWYTFVNNNAQETDKNGKYKYGAIVVSKLAAEGLSFGNKLNFYDDNDIKIVIVEAGTLKPIMVDVFGNISNEGEYFLTSSMLLPKTTFSAKGRENEERFSYSKLKENYLKSQPSKSPEEADSFVKDKVERTLKEYEVFRNNAKESKDVFQLDIYRITPGVKTSVEGEYNDVNETIEGSIDITQSQLIIERSKVNKSTGDNTEEVVDKKTNNNPFRLRRGFLYVNYKNNWELIKPKTLSETGDIDNITNLFKFVGEHIYKTKDNKPTTEAEQAEQIRKFLYSVLYHNASPNSVHSIKYRLFFSKNEDGLYNGIVFGTNNITFDELSQNVKLDALKEFLSNKYWNFNWELLDKKKNNNFIEFKAVEDNGVIKVNETNHKSYRHFLFPKEGQTKGLMNLKPAPKGENSRFLLSKSPQYANQTLQFTIPAKVSESSETNVKETEQEEISFAKGQSLVEVKFPDKTRYLLYDEEVKKFSLLKNEGAAKQIVGALGISDKLATKDEITGEIFKYIRDENKNPITTDEATVNKDGIEVSVKFYKGGEPINLVKIVETKKEVKATSQWKGKEDSANNRYYIKAKEILGETATEDDIESTAKKLYEQSSVHVASTNVRIIERKIKDLNNYKKLNIETARKWLHSKFPSIPVEIIDGIINGNALGAVTESGKILLSSFAEEGTEYHEVWHTFNLFFTSEYDREELYKEVRDRLHKDNLTDRECEEILAEEFRDFMLMGDSYKFNKINETKKESIFRKIINWLKQLFGVSTEKKDIEKAFTKLRNESFTNIISRPDDSFFSRIKGLPAVNAQAYLEDINAKFFDYIFTDLEEGNDIIMNLDVKANYIYKIIKFGYEENNQNGDYSELLAHWENLVKKHKVFMIPYKVDLREDLDEDDILSRNQNDFIDAASKDLKDEVSSPIRLLIGSIPETESIDGKIVPKVNRTFGTSSNIQFDKMMNLINNRIAKAGSEEDAWNRLGSIAETYPAIKRLLRVLGFKVEVGKVTDVGNISKTQFTLRNQLYHAFANTKNTPVIGIVQSDGGIIYKYPAAENEKKVVKLDWINNARVLAEKNNTPYILYDSGSYKINKDTLLSDIRSATKSKNTLRIKEVLNNLGMDVNPRYVLEPNNIHYKYIESLRKELERKDIGDVILDDLYNRDVIENQKEMDSILEDSLGGYINDTDLTYQTIDRNLEWGVTRASHIHEMVDRLNWFINNKDVPISENIRKIFPLDDSGIGNLFTGNSVFINKILDTRGSENPYNFEVIKLQGIKDTKDNGNDLNKEEYFDYLYMSFDSILNNIIPVLRAGDRGPEYAIKFLPNEQITRSIFKERLNGYLFDEVFTSMALLLGGYGERYKNYKDNAKELRSFNFIHNGYAIPRIQEYLISKELSRSSGINLSDIKTIAGNFINEYSDLISKAFDSRIDELIQNNIDELKSWKLIIPKDNDSFYVPGFNPETLTGLKITLNSKDKTMSAQSLNELMMRHAYNYFVGTQEQLKLFIGDIAFYKDGTDLHKRITSHTSTRTKLPNDDVTIDNLNTFYPNVLGKEHSKTIDKYIFDNITRKSKLYGETMKIADGQLWSTMEFARSIKARQGLWEESNEKTYLYETQLLLLRILKDPELQEAIGKSKDDIKDILKNVLKEHTNGIIPSKPMYKGKEIDVLELAAFPAVKPLGVGPEYNEDNLYATDILKMSVAPIIPSLLPNSKLKIYLSLLREGGDLIGDATTEKATYKSAGKFGEITSTTQTNTILFDDFGIQSDTNKEDKKQITDSTQKRRVLFVDTYDNGKPLKGFEDLNELISEHKALIESLSEIELDNLKSFIGLGVDQKGEYYLKDEELFKEKLIELVESRVLPDNVSDSVIEVLDSKTKASDILITRRQIESILMSLPKNRIIKGKVAGEMYVQESSWMYSEEEEDVLDFYSEGKPMEVMVPIPETWRKWVEEIGGIDELNKLINTKNFDKRILTITANRIPTASINTVEAIKIKKFLPYHAGSRIILPGDITIKASSDFDIDKLFTYLNNVKMTKEGPKYIEYLTDENSTVRDRYDIKYYKYRNLEKFVNEIGDKEYQKLLNKSEEPILDIINDLFKNKPLQISLDYWTDSELQEIITEDGKKLNVKEIRRLAKEEEKNAPSFEEFKEYSIEKQNTQKAIENRLNEITFTTLLDPKRFEDLIRPHASENLKKLAEEVSKDRSKSKLDLLEESSKKNTEEESSKENTDVLTEYWYNTRKYREFQASKQLVAYAVSANSINTKLQEHPISITDPLFTLFFEGQELKEGSYSNGFIKDSDNYITSDNFGQFIVAAVDAVKDPFLFELLKSNKLYSLYSFLNKTGIKSGVGLKHLVYFLTNPIVEEYIKELSVLNSIGLNNSIYDLDDLPLARRKSDIINNLLKKYGDKSKTSDDLLSTTYDNYLFARTPEERDIAYNRYNELKRKYNYKYLTLKDLKDEANSVQILDNFLMYQRISGQEIGLLRILRPDASNNFPKSFSGINERVDFIDNTFMEYNGVFNIADIEKYIKNSFLNAFDKTYREASKMYSWFQFIDKDENRRQVFAYVVDRILNNKDNPTFKNRNITDNKDKEKVLSKIENDFFHYIYLTQKYKGATPKETADNQRAAYERLFIGKDSLANRYNRLKRTGKLSEDLIRTIRPVIKEYSAAIGRKRENDYLTTFTKKYNVSHENNITDILYGMMESKDSEIRDFAEDLFEVGLMQSGISGTPISYVKYLPQSIYAKRMDSYISEFFSNSRYPELVEGFIAQFNPVNHQDRLFVPKHDKFAYVMDNGRISIGVGRGERKENSKGEIELFLSKNVGGEYVLIRTKADKALYKQNKKFGRKVPIDSILFKFVEMAPYTKDELTIIKKGGKVYPRAIYQRVNKQGDGPRFLEYYTSTGHNVASILKSNNYGNEKKTIISGYSPENITNLKPNEVFVFGSNTEGKHGKGAALLAKEKFGAKYGQARGMQGQSYAIVTKDLKKGEKSIPLDEIGREIQTMLLYAEKNPNKIFLVTKLGSNLAGYSIEEIRNLFLKLKNFIPENVKLPKEYEVRDKKANEATQLDIWSSPSSTMYQLKNTGISEENIKELDNSMKDFLKAIGVNFIESENLKDKFGDEGITAVADLINMTVSVLEGKTNIQTLPEEAAHFYVHLLDKNSGLYKSMYSNIVNHPIYSKVKEDYKDKYTTETEFREEAIGQLIGKEIVNQYKTNNDRLNKQANTWWNVLWNYIKNLFSKRISDPYAKAAYNILNNKIDKLILSKKEGSEMYQLTSIKEGVNDVFKQTPELSNIGTEEQYSKYLDTIFPDSKVKDIVYRGDKSKTINGVTQFLKGERKDLLFLSTNKEVAKNTLYHSDFSEFIYKKDEFGNLTMTTEYEPDELKGLVRGPKNFITAIVDIQSPLVKNAKGQSYRDYKIDGKNEYETIKEAKEKIKSQENDSLIVENVLEGDIGNLLSTNIGLSKPEQIHTLGSKQDIEGFKKFMNKPNLNKESNIKDGVDFVFEQTPELHNIGSKEQYSQYLNTIFPDSKVKDIVYHNSKAKIEIFDVSKPSWTFDVSRGFYFAKNKEWSVSYGNNLHLVLLNINNLYNAKSREKVFSPKVYDYETKTKGMYDAVFSPDRGGEYVVFEPEQIYILGSKQDIEGFKKYVNRPNLFKESNIDELNKETDNYDMQKILATFDNLFPEESWRDDNEKESIVQGIFNGDLEITCGL